MTQFATDPDVGEFLTRIKGGSAPTPVQPASDPDEGEFLSRIKSAPMGPPPPIPRVEATIYDDNRGTAPARPPNPRWDATYAATEQALNRESSTVSPLQPGGPGTAPIEALEPNVMRETPEWGRGMSAADKLIAGATRGYVEAMPAGLVPGGNETKERMSMQQRPDGAAARIGEFAGGLPSMVVPSTDPLHNLMLVSMGLGGSVIQALPAPARNGFTALVKTAQKYAGDRAAAAIEHAAEAGGFSAVDAMIRHASEENWTDPIGAVGRTLGAGAYAFGQGAATFGPLGALRGRGAITDSLPPNVARAKAATYQKVAMFKQALQQAEDQKLHDLARMVLDDPHIPRDAKHEVVNHIMDELEARRNAKAAPQQPTVTGVTQPPTSQAPMAKLPSGHQTPVTSVTPGSTTPPAPAPTPAPTPTSTPAAPSITPTTAAQTPPATPTAAPRPPTIAPMAGNLPRTQTTPKGEAAQPSESSEAENKPRAWYRGENDRQAPGGDTFYSADQSVAGEFGGGKSGELDPTAAPKNPLRVNSKEELADQIGYTGDPRAEAFDTPPDQRFDNLAKKYAQSKGHDAIEYETGTFDAPELHVFKSSPAPASDLVGGFTTEKPRPDPSKLSFADLKQAATEAGIDPSVGRAEMVRQLKEKAAPESGGDTWHHGSHTDFDEIRPSGNKPPERRSRGWDGVGVWMSGSEKGAGMYGPKVSQWNAKPKNPLELVGGGHRPWDLLADPEILSDYLSGDELDEVQKHGPRRKAILDQLHNVTPQGIASGKVRLNDKGQTYPEAIGESLKAKGYDAVVWRGSKLDMPKDGSETHDVMLLLDPSLAKKKGSSNAVPIQGSAKVGPHPDGQEGARPVEGAGVRQRDPGAVQQPPRAVAQPEEEGPPLRKAGEEKTQQPDGSGPVSEGLKPPAKMRKPELLAELDKAGVELEGAAEMPHRDLVKAVEQVRDGAAEKSQVSDTSAEAKPAPEPAKAVEGAEKSGDLAKMTRQELVARYKPGNPFAEKAASARFSYERLSQPTAHDKAMAQSFPLGVGYGRPGREKRIEATVNRAVKAQEALADAKWQESRAAAFDAGEINAQGRSISPESIERSIKREKGDDARAERRKAAEEIRGDKERWQVRGEVWADSAGYFGGGGRKLILSEHREAVEQALSAGKPVPPEVLADYPDLKKPSATESTEKSESTEKRVTRKDLVDQIEPPPAEGLSSEALATVRLRRADLLKKSVDDLQAILDRRREASEREAKIKPILAYEFPRLKQIAERAGSGWKAALKAEADAVGVSMPPITTRDETAGILANKIAQKRIDKPEPAGDRAATIDKIIAASREPMPEIVEGRQVKGSDGKWYSPVGGFPRGVTGTDETRTYFVFRSPMGTTVGHQRDSRAELEASWHEQQEKKAVDFRGHLEEMSDDRLKSQAEYWAKEVAKKAERARPATPKVAPATPNVASGDSALRKQIRDLEAKKYKSNADEISLRILRAKLEADPSKWKPGDGVGYYAGPATSKALGSQINRGFQIVEVDAADKQVKVRQVADTGLTTSGGNSDRMAAEWIGIEMLVRDRKYDRAEKPEPETPPVPTKHVAVESPTMTADDRERLEGLRRQGYKTRRKLNNESEYQLLLRKERAHAEAEKAAAPKPEPEPADEPEEPVTASIDDIDAQLAERAFAGTSMSPEKRGVSWRQDYVNTFNGVRDRLTKLAKTPDDMRKLRIELLRFRHGLAEKFRAYFAAHANVMSTMITGPANFPVRANEKRSDSANRRLSELVEFYKKAEAAISKNLFPGEATSISSDNPQAVQLLEGKIAEAEKLQEAMVAGNKIVRDKGLTDDQKVEKLMALGLRESTARAALKPDFANRIGFPDYALQNNRANIRRMQDRVTQISRIRSNDAREATFDGGRVVENKEANRVQIIYPSKPDEATRTRLKSRGFRWAPSEGAWQRQGNEAGWRAALEVTGATETKAEAAPAPEESPEPEHVFPPTHDEPATAPPEPIRLFHGTSKAAEIAIRKRGFMLASEHGGYANTVEKYVSLTTDPEVAKKFAEASGHGADRGGGGVVIEVDAGDLKIANADEHPWDGKAETWEQYLDRMRSAGFDAIDMRSGGLGIGEGEKEIALINPTKAKIKQSAAALRDETKKTLGHKPGPGSVDTIAGNMNLDEFEASGYAPEEVTRADWVALQRANRKVLGQNEDSGTAASPNSDYEEYHRDAVKKALARGEEVDEEVLKDYPDLVAKKPTETTEPTREDLLRRMAEASEVYENLDTKLRGMAWKKPGDLSGKSIDEKTVNFNVEIGQIKKQMAEAQKAKDAARRALHEFDRTNQPAAESKPAKAEEPADTAEAWKAPMARYKELLDEFRTLSPGKKAGVRGQAMNREAAELRKTLNDLGVTFDQMDAIMRGEAETPTEARDNAEKIRVRGVIRRAVEHYTSTGHDDEVSTRWSGRTTFTDEDSSSNNRREYAEDLAKYAAAHGEPIPLAIIEDYPELAMAAPWDAKNAAGDIPVRLRTDAFNRALDAIERGDPESDIQVQIEASQNRLNAEQKQVLYARMWARPKAGKPAPVEPDSTDSTANDAGQNLAVGDRVVALDDGKVFRGFIKSITRSGEKALIVDSNGESIGTFPVGTMSQEKTYDAAKAQDEAGPDPDAGAEQQGAAGEAVAPAKPEEKPDLLYEYHDDRAATPLDVASLNPRKPADAERIVKAWQQWHRMESTRNLDPAHAEAASIAFSTLVKPVEHAGPTDTKVYALPGKETELAELAKKSSKVKPDAVQTVDQAARLGGFKAPPISYPAGNPSHTVKPVKDIGGRIKSVGAARAKENSRYAINGVYAEKPAKSGQRLVTTDGRRMFMLKLPKGEMVKPGLYLIDENPVLDTGKGTLAKVNEDPEKNFPPYEEVLPDYATAPPMATVDAAQTLRAVRRAAMLTSEESRGVAVVKNPDGSLGFATMNQERGAAMVNVQDGYEYIVHMNPGFVADALEFILANGGSHAYWRWGKPNKPVVISGDPHSQTGVVDTVTMPVNGGDWTVEDVEMAGESIPLDDVVRTSKRLNSIAEHAPGRLYNSTLQIASDPSVTDLYLKHPGLDSRVKNAIREQAKAAKITAERLAAEADKAAINVAYARHEKFIRDMLMSTPQTSEEGLKWVRDKLGAADDQTIRDLRMLLPAKVGMAGLEPYISAEFNKRGFGPKMESKESVPSSPEADAILKKIGEYQGGAHSPDMVRMHQELGSLVVPGVRLANAEEAGRLYVMVKNQRASADEWASYVADLKASNKISSEGSRPSRGGFVVLPDAETQIKIRGAVRSLRALTLPRTSQIAGEPVIASMTTLAATPTVAKAEADRINSKIGILKNPKLDTKAGAVFTEDRLRGIKKREEDAALAATDPDEIKQHQDNAAAVRTLVGPGQYFPDEAAYQAAKASPEVVNIINAVGKEFVPVNEALFKRAQNLDPAKAPPSGGGLEIQQHVSLAAIRPEDSVPGRFKALGAAYPVSQSGGRLKEKKSRFGRQATGAASLGYDIRLSKMIERSLEGNMKAAHLKLMYDELEAAGIGKRSKIATAPKDIGGLPTAQFRIKDGGLLLIPEDGDATLVPQTMVLSVPRVLVDEIEAVANARGKASMGVIDRLNRKITGINLVVGVADAVSHNTNLMSRLLNAPGVGANLVERIAGHVGPVRLLTALHAAATKWAQVSRQDQKVLDQIAELAKLGVLRDIPEGWTRNPINWVGKGLIERADLATRLALDDAWHFLRDLKLQEDTQEARRRFILQVGQYNRGLSSQFVRFLKDSQLGPFATAGFTFNREAVRTIAGQYGGKARSLPASIAMRGMAFGPWIGTFVAAVILNALIWGDPTPKGMPPGSIKIGETEDKKPRYWDPMAIWGVRRGLRALGLQTAAQQIANDQKPEWAPREAINQWLSPAVGPVPRVASTLALGQEPFLNPDGISLRRTADVVPPGPNRGWRQALENAKTAGVTVVGQMAPAKDAEGGMGSKIKAVGESTFRQYLPQTGQNEQRVKEMPRIIDFASLNDYIDDQASKIRRLKTAGERNAALKKAADEIPKAGLRGRFMREMLFKKRVLAGQR